MDMKTFLQDTANVQYLESLLNSQCLMTHHQSNYLFEDKIEQYKKEFSTIGIKISVVENNVILFSEYSKGKNFIEEFNECIYDNSNAIININDFFKFICEYFIKAEFDVISLERTFNIIAEYRNVYQFDKIKNLLEDDNNIKYLGNAIGNAIYISLFNQDKIKNINIVYSDIEHATDLLLDLFMIDNHLIINNLRNCTHDYLKNKCTHYHNYVPEEYCNFLFMSIVNEIYQYVGVCVYRDNQNLNLSSLYNLQNLNFVKYTESLIPGSNKSPNVLGEIARAFQHILYRILNDGDCPLHNSPNQLSLYNLCRIINKHLSDECEEYATLDKVDFEDLLKSLDIDLCKIHGSLTYAIQSNFLHKIELRSASNFLDICDGIKDSTSTIIVIMLSSFFNWLFINHKDKIDELKHEENDHDSRVEILF